MTLKGAQVHGFFNGWVATRADDYRVSAEHRESKFLPGTSQPPAVPIWELLRQKAREIERQLLLKSSLGNAVSHFLNEYEPLTGAMETRLRQFGIT